MGIEESKMRALIFLPLVLANLKAISAWPECGRRGPQNRVVGGQEAGPGEWPWQVYLQHRTAGSSTSFSCGATILNQDWVLTAAHCLFEDRDPTSYTLTVGDHNVKQDDPYQAVHKVGKIILNPGFADCQRHWRVRERYQMCFGDGNVGGCMGDSGGPLACERQDGRYAVVGVTSYG